MGTWESSLGHFRSVGDASYRHAVIREAICRKNQENGATEFRRLNYLIYDIILNKSKKKADGKNVT